MFRETLATVASQPHKKLPRHWQNPSLRGSLPERQQKTHKKPTYSTKSSEPQLYISLTPFYVAYKSSECFHSSRSFSYPAQNTGLPSTVFFSRSFCTPLCLSQNGISWDVVFPETMERKGQLIQLQNKLLIWWSKCRLWERSNILKKSQCSIRQHWSETRHF